MFGLRKRGFDPAKDTLIGYGRRLNPGGLQGKRGDDAPAPIVLPDEHRKGHFWCAGTTRSGKTRVLENMCEQDIRKGYSVVVIDPKGDLDLFSKIVQTARETGRMGDLQLITPIFPQYSATIDPLSHFYMSEELVGHIVSGVEAGKEKFFFNVAYEISLVIVQALLLTRGEREDHHGRGFCLNDIKNYMSKDELAKLQGDVARVMEGNPAAEQLYRDMQKIIDSPQDYYGKISSSLRVALMELSSGNIGRIVGTAKGNRFIDELEQGRSVILVVHLGSLITSRAALTLGKVVLSMVKSFVGRVFSSGRKVTPPLCVYLDEAQNILFHGIDDLLAKAGGANVWVHGFVQTNSQLSAVLGDDYANVILDNTNTKMFLRVPDHETAVYISRQFGEGKQMAPAYSGDGTITMREERGVRVVEPHDVLTLAPREFFYTGYDGLFRGRTAEVSPLRMEVRFPKIEARNQ